MSSKEPMPTGKIIWPTNEQTDSSQNKYKWQIKTWKKCSVCLAKVQIKIAMQFHLTQSEWLPSGLDSRARRTQAKVMQTPGVELHHSSAVTIMERSPGSWTPLISLWRYCNQICGAGIKTHLSRSIAGWVNSKVKPYSTENLLLTRMLRSFC